MSLQKGFLSNRLHWKEFNKIHVWGAVVVWLLLSFSFYSFMYIIREVLRDWTYYDSREEMLVLTKDEHFFYNFFYACLACIICWGTVMDIFLKGNLNELKKVGHKRFILLNDQTALNAYFLGWFSKIAMVFGFLVYIIHGYKEIDFYLEYKYFFVMLLIVLFLHQWVSIRRVFKRQSLRWMFLSGGCIIIISFGFSRIDLINYTLFERNLVTNNYRLKLPEASEAGPMEGCQNVKKIYFGFKKDSTTDAQLRIIASDGQTELTLEDVSIYSQDDALDAYQPQMISLYVDKNVKT